MMQLQQGPDEKRARGWSDAELARSLCGLLTSCFRVPLPFLAAGSAPVLHKYYGGRCVRVRNWAEEELRHLFIINFALPSGNGAADLLSGYGRILGHTAASLCWFRPTPRPPTAAAAAAATSEEWLEVTKKEVTAYDYYLHMC
ncbi:hypothetical protein VTO42DRAFT_8460 [Malbranchea cinnamomea]